MKKSLLILGVVCLFFGYADVSAQTQFQKTKRYNDGFFLNAGIAQSSFLNSQFSQFREQDIINSNVGFSIGFGYVTYPLIFELAYFSSPYEIKGHNWNYEEDTKVQHRGMEVGVNLALLPNIRQVQPFVGLAYHSSQLGAGLSEDEEQDITETSVNTSGLLLKTGLIANFTSRFGLRGDYRRSLTTAYEDAAFNQFTLTVIIRPEVTTY